MGENYSELSNEKLLNRRNSLKGASIGLGIVALIALAISVYLLMANGSESISTVIFIPIFILPITLLPLMILLSKLNKEIKSRNIR